MRKKEFIIFIIIFTVLYTIFFLVYDKLSDSGGKKRLLKLAKTSIDMSIYVKFANFYGVSAIATKELITKIYLDFVNDKNCLISVAAESYNLSNLEFVVIILYLEYLDLIPKRIISFQNNNIKKLTYVDQSIIQKYNDNFRNKDSYEAIISSKGKSSVNDLNYLNNFFIIPGVRIVNSIIYYVGDYL